MDVYLDHAGATLPPRDLLDDVFADLTGQGGCIGNPHSSAESISRLEEARALVLYHFGISGEQWDVVFTSGGTSSLKLVGELCPFGERGCLLYPENMHTSALSLRCYAENVAVFSSSLLVPLSEGELYNRTNSLRKLGKPIEEDSCDSDAYDDEIEEAKTSKKYNPEQLREKGEAKEQVGYEQEEEDGEVDVTEDEKEYIFYKNKPIDSCVDMLITSGECNFSGQRTCLHGTAAYVLSRNNDMHGDSSSTTAEPFNNRYPSAQLEQTLRWVRGGHASGKGYHAEGDYFSHSPGTGTYFGTGEVSNPRRLLWLLDASKLASSSELNLSEKSLCRTPDFVALSFYKMFGYPTGLGALLVRRTAAALLKPQKKFFGGGTLAAAVATEDWCVLRDDSPHAWLEDGTQHFLGIASLRYGFTMLQRRGGMKTIGARAAELCMKLVTSMSEMTHSTGISLVELYGSHQRHIAIHRRSVTTAERNASILRYMEHQGPIIAFNLKWRDGSPVGYSEVGRLAALRRIRLRTGCFCNVGACHNMLRLTSMQVRHNLDVGRTCWDEAPGMDILDGRSTGAVRVSLGLDSSEEDVAAMLVFLREAFLNRDSPKLFEAALPYHEIDGAMPSKNENTTVVVAEMFVYPIKGCGGLAVHDWPISTAGFCLDREWVVSDSTGRALTMKTHPRLALVRPVLDIPTGTLVLYCAVTPEDAMVSNLDVEVTLYSHRSSEPLALAIGSVLADTLRSVGAVVVTTAYNAESYKSHHSVTSSAISTIANTQDGRIVRVCGHPRPATCVSHDADAWFTSLLGFPCFLSRRSVEEDATFESAVKVGVSPPFANEAALLLISRESVAHLNEMLAEPGSCGTANFRANLVVEGAVAHDEDQWTMISINDASLVVDKPCARCSVINVNGSTGVMDGSTLRTLASYRKDSGNIFFGQFLKVNDNVKSETMPVLSASTGINLVAMLHVGAAVRAVRKKS